MFGARRRRRPFRRRVRFSKQYRTWQMLLADSESEPLTGLPIRALTINSDNGLITDFLDIGGDTSTIGVQTVTEGGIRGQFGFTGAFPLIADSMFAEHGNEFTIRAVHGYLYPQSAATFDSSGTLGTAGLALCRIALAEMEITPSVWTIADQLAGASGAGAPSYGAGLRPLRSLWAANDLKQRIWWMRTFYCGLNQATLFSTPASTGITFVNTPALDRSVYSVRLPRFNMRVRRGRTMPVLLYGYGGGSGSNLTQTTFNTRIHVLTGVSRFVINLSAFLRAFITR